MRAGASEQQRHVTKIGVVGSGIAGLGCAWLLDHEHEVTLFESKAELGGHAVTVALERGGKRAYANPAFGYITPSIYPRFLRLLSLLRVKTISAPTSVTVYSRPRGSASLLTPRLNLSRLKATFAPRMLSALIALQRLLLAARRFDEQDDWQTTLQEFLDQERVSPFLRNEIVLPWVAAIGEATVSEIGAFSARAALKYPVHAQDGTVSQFRLLELDGGVASYIRPLLGRLRTTHVLAGTEIVGMRRAGEKFLLTDAAGGSHVFDHVVLAVPAYAAAKLVATLPGVEVLRATLEAFPYTKARVAVHGDPRWMPPRRTDWSVYNAIFDGTRCEATIWCEGRGEFEYFKSWVTHAERLPEQLYSLHDLHHPIMTPGYHRAQTRLRGHNGAGNLWFAGSFTQDIDSHESGLRSAVEVAQSLSPRSANLRALLGS
jgi:predicted NAD/FAD-binding protein